LRTTLIALTPKLTTKSIQLKVALSDLSSTVFACKNVKVHNADCEIV